MIPNKDRSSTPCWFETQPQGCRKPHCVFQHSKPRHNVTAESSPSNLILPTTDYTPNLTVESKSNEINISIDDDESDDPENHVEEKQKPSDAKPSEEQEKLEKILNSSPIDENNVPKNGSSSTETSALAGEHTQSDKNRKESFQNGKIDCTFVVKPLEQIRKEREAAESSNDKVENLSPTTIKKRALESEGDSKSSNSKPVKIRRNRYSVPSSTNAETSEPSKKSPQMSPDKSAPEPLLKEPLSKSNDSLIEELDFDLEDELLSTTELAPSLNADADGNLEEDELMLEINQLLQN